MEISNGMPLSDGRPERLPGMTDEEGFPFLANLLAARSFWKGRAPAAPPLRQPQQAEPKVGGEKAH